MLNFPIAKKSGARFEVCVCVCWGGGALPYLAYIVRVCAAEYKVLRIKQGVVFYYFKSKILIFLIIILIIKIAQKRLKKCLFGLEAVYIRNTNNNFPN